MIDRIRTPLDYAREVLGRLPGQGIRFDILCKIEGVTQADMLEIVEGAGRTAALDGPASSAPLVEGEFEWL